MKALVLRRTLVLAVATMVLTIGGPLLAAPLYSTSFNGTTTLPTDWAVQAGTTGNPGFWLSGSGSVAGDFIYNGSVSGLSDYTGTLTNGQSSSDLANGTIESNFRKSSAGVYTGLAARIQPSGTSYYAARLYGGNLQVYRFGGSGTAMLGSMAAPGYNVGETWRIEMSLLETQITSKVFDQTGAEIAVVTVNDSQFTKGTAGVRSNSIAVWEDFQISAPEGLNVDIGHVGQQVQPGFQSFTRNYNNTTSPQDKVFSSDLGLANQVNVELSGDSTGDMFGFRDRGNVTHALGDLAEDFVFVYNSNWLDLTLEDLKPGRYQITTYHHDAVGGGVYGTQDVLVSDATRSLEPVTSGLAITKGTSPASIGQTTFSFISNGVDPVVVRMAKNTANFPLLSGFETIAEETLNVDFGLLNNNSHTQADFFRFARNSGSSAAETIASGLGVAGTVDVTVVDVPGGSPAGGWRDRGDMPTIGLGDLAEDFVYSWNRLELTLGGLAAGQYAITTYHHELGGSNWAPFDIDVDDAWGLRTVATDFTDSGGQNDPALLTFTFQADGINPVIIGFDPDSGIAMLNGFSLARAVPEPSSLTLLALGLMGLCMATGRRKRV